MTTILQTNYTKDEVNRKIIVHRTFNAPLNLVWRAWTEKEILDQWWAPKPWQAETKTMNFTVGGMWLYAMAGPDGEQHWSKADYKVITPLKEFTCIVCFCDENGTKNDAFQTSSWQVHFKTADNITNVLVEITFEKSEDLQKMIEMGFEQGFAMAHSNLEELLNKLK